MNHIDFSSKLFLIFSALVIGRETSAAVVDVEAEIKDAD